MCAGVGGVLGRMAGAGDTGGTEDVAGAVLLAAALSLSTLTGAACCCCCPVVGGVVPEPRKGKDACSEVSDLYIVSIIESTFVTSTE
jgi:hypothetical protein